MLYLFLFLLIIVCYWWNATSAKDLARSAALKACQLSETIILDDAVEIRKIWLRRNEKGHIEICRFYFFDFTVDGNQRFHAFVILLGQRVYKVSMNADDI